MCVCHKLLLKFIFRFFSANLSYHTKGFWVWNANMPRLTPSVSLVSPPNTFLFILEYHEKWAKLHRNVRNWSSAFRITIKLTDGRGTRERYVHSGWWNPLLWFFVQSVRQMLKKAVKLHEANRLFFSNFYDRFTFKGLKI